METAEFGTIRAHEAVFTLNGREVSAVLFIPLLLLADPLAQTHLHAKISHEGPHDVVPNQASVS